MHIKHIETDSLWQEASTNYWFECTDELRAKGKPANSNLYGVNVFEDEPAEEFWTLLDSEGHPVESDSEHVLDELVPHVKTAMFKDWQDSREYLPLDDIAGWIGMDKADIHETATHGWLYDARRGCEWIVDTGNGEAWSLVEREDYTGTLESIERWVFNSTRTL